MPTLHYDFKSGAALSSKSIIVWRIIQMLVWCIGAFLLFCLLFFPTIGVLLFWNILIPIAPLLFVVALGIWRNVCPLATTNLLPRKLGLSQRKKMSPNQSGVFSLIAVIALYLIVPLRHAVFNMNGVATGIMIVIMAIIGVSLGFIYEWKSAWCSGLCPIQPVEKLYGANVVFSMPNANCDHCQNCVVPCPDSTPNMSPINTTKTIYHKISGWMIVAGLPGFIWGWFNVPDNAKLTSWPQAFLVYKNPFIGWAVSSLIYLLLTMFTKKEHLKPLGRVFAAAGVSIYYRYRIPALIGFGKFNQDGLLYNLNGQVPAWLPDLLTIISTAFFFHWLVIRKPNKSSWLIRPPFAKIL